MRLSTNSWHWKLQCYVFGDYHVEDRAKSLCPYFWLTIFCLLATPGLYVSRSVKSLYKKFERAVLTPVGNWIDQKFINPRMERLFENLTYGTLQKWEEQDDDYWFSKWVAWVRLQGLDPYAERARLRKVFFESEQNAQELRQKRNLERRERKQRISDVTEKIGMAIVYIIFAAIVGFLGWLTWWAWTNLEFSWENFKVILTAVLILVCGGTIGYLIAQGVKWLFTFLRTFFSGAQAYPAPMRKSLKQVLLLPIKRAFAGIRFVWDFIMKNYCPMIEWTDEKKS